VFGTGVSVAVPDLDRTDYLMILGANPYASNGSVCTAPDFPGRIEAIRARGGKVVVVDPRRTRTAEEADQWIAIRPATDALFLMAIVNVLFAENLVKIQDHIAPLLNGLDEVREASQEFTPERVAHATGLEPEVMRQVARELSAAKTAALYGRIGTTTTEFGTTASWLVDVVNTLTGNLDSVGGVMFTKPALGGPTTRGASGKGGGFRIGRGGGKTKVKGYPEVMGEYPAAAMAEEITDAGDAGIKALVTVAGNPILSTPHSRQLSDAFEKLELMISVDLYLNETTRHADVILPVPSQLQRDHYDVLLLQFAIRNVANYSTPVLPLDDGQPDEWEILAKLGMIAQGLGPDADPHLADDLAIEGLVRNSIGDHSSPIHGRNADEIIDLLNAEGRRGPARMLDFMLQTGPYGAGFGTNTGGASLQLLLDNPHGVDFGALESRLPDALRTRTGMIELAPEPLLADVSRLLDSIEEFTKNRFVLVGRRHLKTNNSWMHNIQVLVKGSVRCSLQMHTDDAKSLDLLSESADEVFVSVTSRVGSVVVPVEITDDIRPGVVSLPHGWGHDHPGTKMRVAESLSGVNSNILSDHEAMDPLSGTSVLNGIPVSIAKIG
jgi:anaerobic selenocysteine-containing dehydrogenase